MRRLIKSFGFAFTGIATVFRSEPNMFIHLMAAIVAIGLSIWLKITPVEWCIVVLCIGMVMALEAVNTAIEGITDKASPEIHPLAKKAKDTAAGAVLIASICSAVVAGIIFLPKLIKLF